MSELSSKPQSVSSTAMGQASTGRVSQSIARGTSYIKTTRGTFKPIDAPKSEDGGQKSAW